MFPEKHDESFSESRRVLSEFSNSIAIISKEIDLTT